MKRNFDLLSWAEPAAAMEKWSGVGKQPFGSSGGLTESYGFAVALGDLILIEGGGSHPRWPCAPLGALPLPWYLRPAGPRIL